MEEFLLKYGGEIITLIGSLVTALIARRKEKKLLRSKGLLRDSEYFNSNGQISGAGYSYKK